MKYRKGQIITIVSDVVSETTFRGVGVIDDVVEHDSGQNYCVFRNNEYWWYSECDLMGEVECVKLILEKYDV
jgi:hypothetical protein